MAIKVIGAGVGRTGTYIALENLIQEAHEDQATKPSIDIYDCVTKLRTQRMNMVQTAVGAK